MDFWPSSWNLRRNPLVPSVPLEGTDTVRGLSTLERMRTADLIGSKQEPKKKENVGVRRRYQRYKGPFVEFLGLEDVKRDAKSWNEFGGRECTRVPRDGGVFSIPASLDLLAERVDENLVYYFGNYMRLFLYILVLMTYLRPKSILGIAVLGYNVHSNYERALQATQAPQQEASNKTILMAAATWLVMMYSKCMPIVLLAMVVSLVAIMVHAVSRASSSECRYRGKRVIAYSLSSIWRGDGDPYRILKDIGLVLEQSLVKGYRWAVYYSLVVRDRLIRSLNRGRRNESWK